MAAALFTFLSFKGLSSLAGAKGHKAATALDSYFKSKIPSTDKIIISGIIKDSDGKPLEKAIVMFDTVQVAVTDSNGKYSFEMETVNAVNHTLYFNYEGLITTVRTYHPAMLSSYYDVVLYKKATSTHSMGVPAPIFGSEGLGALSSLDFKKKESRSSADNKAKLVTIAAKLRSIPSASISLTAFSGVCSMQHRSPHYSRLENIKKYLIENEGISSDRIITICETVGNDTNRVEVKQADQ